MALIAEVAPGQVLFTVTHNRVEIKVVDPAGQFVMASWNGCPVREYCAWCVDKWFVQDPGADNAAQPPGCSPAA